MASGELGQFVLVAAGTVAIAVPIILKTIRLPRHLELQLIPNSQLTPKQREFFASYDSQLKALGFEPFTTYRMSNIPKSKNLLRTYFSSTEPTRCTVQISAATNGPVQFDQVHFVTEFADKSQTFTTNRLNSETFDREPDKFVLECRGLTDLSELKLRHDQFTEQYRRRSPVFVDRDNFETLVKEHYDREVSHQVRQKLLWLDAAKDEYRVTLRWALRMQRNMFNPFADNFTVKRLAMALAAGSLPVLANLGQAQRLHSMNQANVDWVPGVMLAYVVAGVAAGLLFGHKSFLWAFLLALIPTFFLPATTHNIGMSLLMGWAADLTFRLQARRKRLV
jgi:hypothetical protein